MICYTAVMDSYRSKAPLWLALIVSAGMSFILASGADNKRDRALWGLLGIASVALAGRSAIASLRGSS